MRQSERILGCISGILADFVGADDIINFVSKEREPEIEIIERLSVLLLLLVIPENRQQLTGF